MDQRYRKFLAVSETGSFSAAAKKLHVTQPAVTIAVASLEHSLGVKLYVRRRTPIKLTPEGEIVTESARKIAAEVDAMQTSLAEAQRPKQRQIGLIDSIAHLLYSSPGERTWPGDAEVMVDNSRRILRDLASGKLELGVITGQPAPLGSDIAVQKLHDEEFVFVTAPQRALRKTAKYIDDWLAVNRDSTSYRFFTELFAQKGLDVTPIFYSASMELLRDMAVAGKGTALLPKHVIQDALNDGTLQVVRTKPLYRPIWAVSRRQDGTRGTKTFAAHISGLLAGE